MRIANHEKLFSVAIAFCVNKAIDYLMLKQKLAKWLDWLKLIQNDVTLMLEDRYIYREVMKIVDRNPATHDPNDFVVWFQRQYGDATCARVRRLCDNHRDAVSLRNLISDIGNNSLLLTRQWYHGGWGSEKQYERQRADKAFDKWSGEGKPTLTLQ